MGAISPMHIVLIAVVALLIFGPNKLPELGRGIGKMFREFKDVTTGNDVKETNNRKEINTTKQKKKINGQYKGAAAAYNPKHL